MRVLMVGACPFPTAQGSQVYMGAQARALASAGLSLRLLTYGHGDGRHSGDVEHVRLPTLPGYRSQRSGPHPAKLLLDGALFQRLMVADADLFHAHNYEAALICGTVGRIRGIPALYDAHGILSEELPTYFPSGARWRRRAAAWVGAAVDRRLAELDGVIAISAEGERRLRQLGARRLWRIPPGVEPGEYAGGIPPRAAQPTVVYAGNPDAYQDLPILYEAMHRLPGLRLRLVTHTRDWQLPAFLQPELCLVQSWEEARAAIASAWVAALPRRSCPGFPIKLLNYLGLGVPTVISHGSAQGLPGEIPVEPQPAAFAAALLQTVSHTPAPFRQQFLAENAWDRRVQEILAVYQVLLEGQLRR